MVAETPGERRAAGDRPDRPAARPEERAAAAGAEAPTQTLTAAQANRLRDRVDAAVHEGRRTSGCRSRGMSIQAGRSDAGVAWCSVADWGRGGAIAETAVRVGVRPVPARGASRLCSPRGSCAGGARLAAGSGHGAAATTGLASAAPTCGSFALGTLPSVGGSGGGSNFSGISLASPSDQWAVGDEFDASLGVHRTLTEHFDGHSWTVVPSPNWPEPAGTSPLNNGLNDVSMGAGNGWAVGMRWCRPAARRLTRRRPCTGMAEAGRWPHPHAQRVRRRDPDRRRYPWFRRGVDSWIPDELRRCSANADRTCHRPGLGAHDQPERRYAEQQGQHADFGERIYGDGAVGGGVPAEPDGPAAAAAAVRHLVARTVLDLGEWGRSGAVTGKGGDGADRRRCANQQRRLGRRLLRARLGSASFGAALGWRHVDAFWSAGDRAAPRRASCQRQQRLGGWHLLQLGRGSHQDPDRAFRRHILEGGGFGRRDGTEGR